MDATCSAPTVRRVTLITGQSRDVQRCCPDGTYECPWCSAPVFSPEGWGDRHDPYPRYIREAYEAGKCPNPACVANPRMGPERVNELLAHRARVQAEREEDERRRERWAAEAAADRERETARWTEVKAEAERRGACLTCLVRSNWRFGEPKYVRHRTAGFHEDRR